MDEDLREEEMGGGQPRDLAQAQAQEVQVQRLAVTNSASTQVLTLNSPWYVPWPVTTSVSY